MEWRSERIIPFIEFLLFASKRKEEKIEKRDGGREGENRRKNEKRGEQKLGGKGKERDFIAYFGKSERCKNYT